MAFSGEIYIQIADGNSIAFTSAPQAVTIANGENKLLTFTETVTGIEPDDDYFDLSDEQEEDEGEELSDELGEEVEEEISTSSHEEPIDVPGDDEKENS